MDAASALSALPIVLRDELLAEYRSVIQNYSEHRWSPAELSGGRFCEIVYSIIFGYASGSYPSRASKPADFVGACRTLEKNTHVPRSFQILIPRILPALYEIRNNRGVGHVGGEVDPNHMDATFVVSSANWIMAELVRVLHSLSTKDAQQLVDTLTERRYPLVWEGQDIKRVLDPKMDTSNQVLLLLIASGGKVGIKHLQTWTGYKNVTRFFELIKAMHEKRLVEFFEKENLVEILPPGQSSVTKLVAARRA